MAATPDEECVICVNAKAVMQTYPCGHKVVCRRCFVKTIQIALSQRTLPLCCVICRTKILRLKHTECSRTSTSMQPFHCRQSSRNPSKRSSDILRSNCSLETSNPWPSRNKYSRSLPGINNGSFRFKSSVNRSHSAVVYCQPANSMRKCYRSCSLASCSSENDSKNKSGAKSNYRHQINCDQYVNSQKDCNATRTNENFITSDFERLAADEKCNAGATTSREKLIRQFQRDFKDGQLSTRRTSIRTKSPLQKVPALSPKRFFTKNVEIKCDLKADSKQVNVSKRKVTEKTKSCEDRRRQDKPSKTKDKQSNKVAKLMKLEGHSKNKFFHKVGKNFKTTKKDNKTTDRKINTGEKKT